MVSKNITYKISWSNIENILLHENNGFTENSSDKFTYKYILWKKISRQCMANDYLNGTF